MEELVQVDLEERVLVSDVRQNYLVEVVIVEAEEVAEDVVNKGTVNYNVGSWKQNQLWRFVVRKLCRDWFVRGW